MKPGDAEISLLMDGMWCLDGGAFFGIVPRVLWERQLQPDARNRVPLNVNCVLLRMGGKNILVETGLGTKHSVKQYEIFDMQTGHLFEELRGHGLQPEDIDYVLFTHLHWDHIGGATYRAAARSLRMVFSKAQHLVQLADWEEATHHMERNRAGYFGENLAHLLANKQLELLDGDKDIILGLSCRLTGGHASGHQITPLNVDDGNAVFSGDLVPTVCYLPLPYGQSYGVDSNDLLRRRGNCWLWPSESCGWRFSTMRRYRQRATSSATTRASCGFGL